MPTELSVNSLVFSEKLETTDDEWQPLVSLPMDQGVTLRVTVVARLPSTGETMHWASIAGAQGTGSENGETVTLNPIVSSFGGSGLAAAELRLRIEGESLVLDVKGLDSTSVWWAGE